MALKVAGTLFNSNGGGGGGFYFSGGQQDRRRDEQRDEAEATDLSPDETNFSLGSPDRSFLPGRAASALRLGLPAAPLPEAPLAAIGLDDEAITRLLAEVHGKLRVLEFAVTRVEQSYLRRQHAEVGELRVG
ncbi:MAG: hypothetical protein VKS61_12740 [Candidatus Sericytochromatia bacterium]|nr:hypothetical protein [Candidatus Sericytochromatia bacterium]